MERPTSSLNSCDRFYRVQKTISGSASASVDSSTNSQVYTPTLESGYQLKNGTVTVSVNGLELISNSNQNNSAKADFYISSSLSQINVRKLYTNGWGIDLVENDVVTLSYQQEKT